jgi:glycosyltransferase involved in cell wall biosynthesis
MSIAIIIPTLNEIDGIKQIMLRVKKEWAEEIVIVDGGSTDGTIEEAIRQGFKIIHQKDKGAGNAMRLGVKKTNSDYIMFFSPDGNHIPEDIPKLIEKIREGYDMVSLSRFGKNSTSEDASMYFYGHFGNNMFAFLVNVFFGGHYTDSLNGFRIFTRKAFEKLETTSESLIIDQETYIKALKKNLKTFEIEGDEPKRMGGKRKMKPLVTGADLSWQIIKEYIFWNK